MKRLLRESPEDCSLLSSVVAYLLLALECFVLCGELIDPMTVGFFPVWSGREKCRMKLQKVLVLGEDANHTKRKCQQMRAISTSHGVPMMKDRCHFVLGIICLKASYSTVQVVLEER